MTTYTDIILRDTANNYFIPYGLIDRLGDVDISNPTTGQNLTYDGTTGKWKNSTTSATVGWGGITGTLSNQTDLNTALSGKQDSLVSGTNIKTINNTSLLGSGNISVLQNTATGKSSISILGNSTSKNSSINIGYNSSISNVYGSVAIGDYATITASQDNGGKYNTAIGCEASITNATNSVAIGFSAIVSSTNSIQLGYGTNSTANTFNVGFSDNHNYQLLDGSTGLIPDARISSNIARTSAIPTQASILEAVYPVGSIYMSVNNVSPATLFGFGTWEQIKDTFLLACGDTYSNADTGGASTVTLTTNEIPSHNHTASSDSTGAHTHGKGSYNITGNYAVQGWGNTVKCNGAFSKNTEGTYYLNGDGDSDSGYKSGLNFNASKNWSGSTQSKGDHSHTITVNNNGGGQAHDNMPPYLAVYIWKRVA